MAKKTKDGYQVVGGDNVAESLLGHIKSAMRRTGAVRGGPQGSKRKSVQVLSSAGLLRTPGLLRVLDAYRSYRQACCSGLVKVSPRVAWSVKDCPWLYKEADDADDKDA